MGITRCLKELSAVSSDPEIIANTCCHSPKAGRAEGVSTGRESCTADVVGYVRAHHCSKTSGNK